MSDISDLTPLPENEAQPPAPPSGGNNRTFLIAIGILGGIFIITLLLMAAYVLFLRPQSAAQRSTQVAMINAQNTATIRAATQAAGVSGPKQATNAVPPTVTATPTKRVSSSTPVIAVATSTAAAGPVVTLTPSTAQAGQAIQTATPTKQVSTSAPTATALPSTGFADEAGIPGLLGLAVLFLAIIFLVRRLRSA